MPTKVDHGWGDSTRSTVPRGPRIYTQYYKRCQLKGEHSSTRFDGGAREPKLGSVEQRGVRGAAGGPVPFHTSINRIIGHPIEISRVVCNDLRE